MGNREQGLLKKKKTSTILYFLELTDQKLIDKK